LYCMKNYHHFSQEQRYQLEILLKTTTVQKEIAHLLGVSESTISRERKRNSDQRNGSYRAMLAQRKAEERQQKKERPQRFTATVQVFVEKHLKLDLSPEQIVGVARKESVPIVSHERIYQHIWLDKKRSGNLYEHLRNQGRRYRHRGAKKDQRGRIKGQVSIVERPAVVDKRIRFGDLEIDTVIGKNHKGALLTINDRKTGLAIIRKLDSKNALELANATIQALTPYKGMLHTITSDNGKEFAFHQLIAKELNIDFYFARPYHSWERGANENLNRLIRQYFPKKTDFAGITNQDVERVQHVLNTRPRKRLTFEAPLTIFGRELIKPRIALQT
jgi:transposase, IS30 family